MMDGILFHWISWIFCVIILFFMKKGKRRTYFSYWVLISIILVNQFITIDMYTISLSFIIIFLGSFLGLASLKKPFYHLIVSFIMMIGYAGVLLIEKNAPIWIFGPRYLTLAIMSFILVTTLTKGFYSKTMVTLVGLSSGEVLYNLIVSNYFSPKTFGELEFMDTLLLTLFLLFLLNQYQRVKHRLNTLINQGQIN
ncbi:hypothetical protein KQI49_07000 [Virgibacillus sp. MSJ-26]|uniref:YphA family membrane protein n=1 Tax=Virgibacillus sp. MSJ-26 TaxID=2841522 RepID=UPI001C10C1D5|nr:hypothetical protein [Virgibacillus sp. MSJ-26]MBU5466577.1 hypothetical protein [Virgibacillus sp. MSJ-26]